MKSATPNVVTMILLQNGKHKTIFLCGLIPDGKATIDEMGETIFKLILETASGKPSKSEIYGFGDHEFVPGHLGAIL